MVRTRKELRIFLEPEVRDLIIAASKARNITPARYITEAVMLQADLAPRMREAILALEQAKAEGDRIGVVSDFIADLYRADEAAE